MTGLWLHSAFIAPQMLDIAHVVKLESSNWEIYLEAIEEAGKNPWTVQ